MQHQLKIEEYGILKVQTICFVNDDYLRLVAWRTAFSIHH